MIRSLTHILLLQIFVFSCCLFSLGTNGWAQEPEPPSSSSEIIGVDHAIRTLADGAWTEKKIAVAYLIEHGEPALLPQLEELRSNVNRRVRRLMKPVINLLRNKANLVSEDSEARRAAARDLGTRGGPEALPLLQNALSHENDRWVRYDLEEAINLINLEHADPQVRLAAITKLGDLRSAFALPDLEELAQQPADNLEQQTLANAAAEASRRIQQWHDITGEYDEWLSANSQPRLYPTLLLPLQRGGAEVRTQRNTSIKSNDSIVNTYFTASNLCLLLLPVQPWDKRMGSGAGTSFLIE